MPTLENIIRRRLAAPLFTLMLAVGLVGLSACDAINVPGLMGSDDSGTARMQVLLVDNPFPFDLVDEVNVTISRVDIRDGERSVTVMNKTEQFNLLELRNGVSAELGDLELPAGEYKEIRMVVDDASVLMKDGRIFDLKVPSGTVKVKLDGIVVEDGQDVSLTLDFDVDKSFVVQGNPNTPAGIKGFLLKPTVISKGMKENGRRGGDRDDDDDDGDDENGNDDEGDDQGDDNGDDEGDDQGDDQSDDQSDDNSDDEGDENGDQDVAGIVTAIESVDGSTFVTVGGLQILVHPDETEFVGIAGVEDLVVDESAARVWYYQDGETDVLIATKVEALAWDWEAGGETEDEED